MPSRNIVKEFAEGEYYHVYNRGVEKREIFLDDNDYVVFLGILKKYLSGERDKSGNRHKFESLHNDVELLAYCLMPNHVHLLLYQKSGDGITKLMRRVMTGYAMYFNHKYHRVGSLFQGRYKAAHINADDYLQHISRYIHLNPKDYRDWEYSSLPYYIGKKSQPNWLNTEKVLSIFSNTRDYEQFLEDYVDSARELSVLKWQLANDPGDD